MDYREWEENEARIERAERESERFDRHCPIGKSEHEETPIVECSNQRCEDGRVACWANGMLYWAPCLACKAEGRI